MSKDKGPYHPISDQELLDYLDGKIKGIRAHEIERQILNSSFEEEALDGLSSIDSADLRKDLSQLKKRLDDRSREKSGYLNIAATIAFLIAAFGSLWFVMNIALPHDEISFNRTPVVESEESMNLAMNDQDSAESTDLNEDVEPTITAADLKPDSTPDTPTLAQAEDIRTDSVIPVEELAFASDVETDDDSIIEPDPIVESVEVAALSASEAEESFNDTAVSESPIAARTEGAGAAKRQSINDSAIATSKAAAPAATSEAIPLTEIISGTVYYREDGEPLPGVKVTINGATTTTGLNGKFEIANSGDGQVLELSHPGTSPKNVGIDDSGEINVVMAPDASTLREISIIGYGQGEASPTIKSPEPVPGVQSFKEYIETYRVYPQEAANQQIEGVVVLKLTISSEGVINNIEVKKSVSDACDKEAIRLLREGPQWRPALYNGDPVEGSVRVRIPFMPPN